MKQSIDIFLNITDQNLLPPFYEDLKIKFKQSTLYDDSSYNNFCEIVEIYIKEFNIEFYRNINKKNILLYGGF